MHFNATIGIFLEINKYVLPSQTYTFPPATENTYYCQVLHYILILQFTFIFYCFSPAGKTQKGYDYNDEYHTS